MAIAQKDAEHENALAVLRAEMHQMLMAAHQQRDEYRDRCQQVGLKSSH